MIYLLAAAGSAAFAQRTMPPSLGAPTRAVVRLVALETDAHAVLDAMPDEPSPELEWDAAQTLETVCLGLQHNNYPEEDAGLVRLYHYLHPRGRVDIAPPPPKAGLQGFVSLEDFMRDAAHPALGSLLMCSNFKLIGELTVTPPGQARGAFATQMIEVHNNEPQSAAALTREEMEVKTLEGLIAGEAACVASGCLSRSLSHSLAPRSLTSRPSRVAAPDDFLERVLAAMRNNRPPPQLPLTTRASKGIPKMARFLVQVRQAAEPTAVAARDGGVSWRLVAAVAVRVWAGMALGGNSAFRLPTTRPPVTLTANATSGVGPAASLRCADEATAHHPPTASP